MSNHPAIMLMNDERHVTLLEWWRNFEDVTNKARDLSEKDRNFYDGIQWTTEEIQDLEDRGQPLVTYNRIAPKINFVVGSEISNRVDPKARPRTLAGDESADAISDAIRYVCDANDFNEQDAEVVEDISIEGYGGYIVHPEGKGKKRKIKITMIPWDRIWFDPYSRKADFSDARYLGVVMWWDFEEAKKRYPGDAALMAIEESKNSNNEGTDSTTFDDKPRWYDTERKRVRVFECYWQETNTKGEVEWWSAHFCWGGFVKPPKKLEFKTDQGESYCPILLTTAFVARNFDNRRYGLCRNMISPQEEINKRGSKSLHLLSMRQVIYEEDAVDDIQETQTQLAMPDGAIKVRIGALSEKRIDILPTGDLAQGQLTLWQEAKAAIDQTGPDAALVASGERQMSGRLFLARQQAGQMELGRVFDNIRALKIRVYKVAWYQIRQFWGFEKWLRVRDSDERAGFRFVGLNQKMSRAERFQTLLQEGVPPEMAIVSIGIPAPDAQKLLQGAVQQIDQELQQAAQQTGQPLPPEEMQRGLIQLLINTPAMQESFVINDVEQIDVDIEIDVVQDTSIVQQEQFTELMKLVQTGQMQLPPDVLLEMSDIRDKKKIISRLTQPDPQQQQQQQLQMEQMQLQIENLKAAIMLTTAKTEKEQVQAKLGIPAEAKKDEAQAMKAAADAGAQTNQGETQ